MGEGFRTEGVGVGTISRDGGWLVEGLVPEVSWGILAAEAKVGKTWLATDLAVSVATGTPFLGRKVKQSSVVYVHAEDRRDKWLERVEGLLKARGLERSEEVPLFGVSDEMQLDKPEDMTKLEETVEKHNAGLLVLDPMAFLHGLDENSAGFMLPVYRGLSRIAKQRHAMVFVVQHMSKPRWDGGGRQAHRIRGTTAAHAWADLLMYLELRRGGYKRLSVESRSFAPEGFPALLALENKSNAKALFYQHVFVEAPVGEEPAKAQKADYVARVKTALHTIGPKKRTDLAVLMGGTKQKVLTAVKELEEAGVVRERPDGCVEFVP